MGSLGRSPAGVAGMEGGPGGEVGGRGARRDEVSTTNMPDSLAQGCSILYNSIWSLAQVYSDPVGRV